MRAKFFALCVWLLVASGTFLFTSGLLDYWESHGAQREIAQQWQQDEAEQTSSDSTPLQGPDSPDKAPLHDHRPAPTRVRPGNAVAKLVVPRLGASLYVIEGTDDRDLKRGPGHLTGSVMPGGDGNCVIAGHRDTHFSFLKNIQKGDQILLERAGKTFRYRVDGMEIVTPDNTESLQPTKDAVLHLITCYPFHYVGSAPKRFIVHAELEDSTLSAAR